MPGASSTFWYPSQGYNTDDVSRHSTEVFLIEAPCSKLQGMFCLAAVLRSDCKELYNFWIRSLTPQQAAGNALAAAVQIEKNIYHERQCEQGIF
jgi:hypothetical protein